MDTNFDLCVIYPSNKRSQIRLLAWLLWTDFDLQHKYTHVHTVQHNIAKYNETAHKKNQQTFFWYCFNHIHIERMGQKWNSLIYHNFIDVKGKFKSQINITLFVTVFFFVAGFLIFFHSSTVFDNVGSFYKLCNFDWYSIDLIAKWQDTLTISWISFVRRR